jgi:hypothetical protein
LRITKVDLHAEAVLVKSALIAATFGEAAAAGTLERSHGSAMIERYALRRLISEPEVVTGRGVPSLTRLLEEPSGEDKVRGGRVRGLRMLRAELVALRS